VGGLSLYACSPNASEQSVPYGRRAAGAVTILAAEVTKPCARGLVPRACWTASLSGRPFTGEQRHLRRCRAIRRRQRCGSRCLRDRTTPRTRPPGSSRSTDPKSAENARRSRTTSRVPRSPRHKMCGHRHPGQQITTKPLPAVVAKSPQPRNDNARERATTLGWRFAPSTHLGPCVIPDGARTAGKRSGVTAVFVSASYWSVDLRYGDIAELAQLHRLRDSCSGPGVGHPNVPRP
jgi:hypothetical protein